jgi:lysophospholipase L1-like esterase
MAPTRPRLTLLKRLLFSLLATLLGLGALELAMRVVLPVAAPQQHHAILEYRHTWFPNWDPSPIFEPHPYVAYVHVASGAGVNPDGFTFEAVPRPKPDGVFRIAALGGSTTDGPHAWPFHLARKLERLQPGIEVQALNFGMSGWTSAESLVNFVINVQDYDPDVVIVHHAANDMGAIYHPDFHPDYRHYRRVLQVSADEQGDLRLRQRWTYKLDAKLCRYSLLYVWARIRLLGEGRSDYSLTYLTTWPNGPRREVAESERIRPFLRNLRTIGTLAEANGSRVLFASIPWVRPEVAPDLAAQWGPGLDHQMAQQNERLLGVATENGWGALDLDAVMSDKADLYVDPIHMTQPGEVEKAERIAAYIDSQGWLPGRPASPAVDPLSEDAGPEGAGPGDAGLEGADASGGAAP